MNRKMKDSGVEWIGEIPNNWELIPLGKKYIHRNEKVSDKDFEALSVTKNGIYKQLENVAKTNNGDSRKKVCKGDFVINSRSDRKQSCGISDYFGSVSLINIVLSPNKISSNYTKYLLDNYGFAEEFYKHGTGIVADLWSTKFDRMKRIIIPLPDENEQETIGIYLDKKCLQIDSIIEKSKEVIEEYKKYKQSLITETVTKGLDKNVSLKESGIEWIGEVPEKWEMTKLKYIFDFSTGLSISKSEYKKEGDLIIGYGDIHSTLPMNTCVEKDICKYVSSIYGSTNPMKLLQNNDFLFADTSEDYEGCGNFTRIINKHNILVLAGGHTVMAKLKKKVIPNYFAYLLQSDSVRMQIRSLVNGIKVFSVTQKILKQISMYLPSNIEQLKIADYLDNKCAEIDKIISQKEQLINELETYKKSLIYECVTGKREVV